MVQKPSILIQIVHINGPHKGQIQEFGGNRVTVGRHPDCDVVFPKDLTLISRRHAKIQRDGNRFSLTDESTNGTFVNGKPISEAPLKSGDVITVGEGGPKISFLTQVGKEPTVSPPSGESAAGPAEPKRDPLPRQEPDAASPQPGAVFTPPAKERRPGRGSASPWDSSRAESQPAAAAPANPPAEIPVAPSKQPLMIQYGPRLESFKGLPVTLGSGDDCDFMIDHADLCPHHAQIFYHQDQYWIKDLSGRNLVAVNGVAIQSPTPLSPQSRLALSPRGPHFSFLGGGRMAEITSPEPPVQDREDGKQSPTAEDKEGKSGKLSSFVRRFKH